MKECMFKNYLRRTAAVPQCGNGNKIEHGFGRNEGS